MADDDEQVRHPESACRLNVFEIASAQELGAHETNEPNPGEQQQNSEQDKEAWHQHRGNDQEQVKLWNRRPDLDEALEQEIDTAAEISLHRACGYPDNRRDDRERQAEQNGDAKAVDQAGGHVSGAVIGSEPIVFQIAAAF